MTSTTFQLEELTCPSCIKKIEGKLGKVAGVEEVKVLFNSSKVKALFKEDQITSNTLKEIIEKLGYQVLQ